MQGASASQPAKRDHESQVRGKNAVRPMAHQFPGNLGHLRRRTAASVDRPQRLVLGSDQRMAIVKAEERPPYLDLDNAVEVEEKLTRALDAVQAHSDRLQQKQESGDTRASSYDHTCNESVHEASK